MKVRFLITFCYWMIASLTLLGTLLRLTFRDSYTYTATLYYVTPLPLLVAGAVVLCLRQRFLKYWKRSRLCAGYGLILFVWWVNVDWKNHPQPLKSKDEFVVLLANIARDQNIDLLEKSTQEFQPDIICFVEALALTAAQRAKWEKSFPEYYWSMVDGGTQLFSKGTIRPPWVKPLRDGSRLSRSIIDIDGKIIHCYTVDIASTIHRSRKPAIDELVSFLNETNDENVLILGDFNTPSDSVLLASLRTGHMNLFETAGTGYAPTWPFPLSVLTLDQIWIDDHLEPIGCQIKANWRSDHRMLIGRFRIRARNSK